MSNPTAHLLVEISEQPIALCQLLKIANLVSGGGEAKVVISEGYVLLNGEVEYQKRKKIYDQDIVEFNGEVIQVLVNTELEAIPASIGDEQDYIHHDANDNQPSVQSINKKSKSNAEPSPYKSVTNSSKPLKRKPISF